MQHSLQHVSLTLSHLYIKVRSGDFWPASNWLLSTCRDNWEGGASERRRRTVTFVYSSLLHHRRCYSDGRSVKWYFGDISHKQIKLIALSLFTRRRHVARSANYPGHGPGARSLQSVVGTSRQRSCAVHSADTAVAYIRLYSQIASCTWRRRDAEVRKSLVFCK